MLLICEGACNPSLPTFDHVAQFYADAVIRQGLERSAETDRVRAILIGERVKLQHTAHGHLSGNTWACLTCLAERRYGSADLAVDWRVKA